MKSAQGGLLDVAPWGIMGNSMLRFLQVMGSCQGFRA